MNLANHVFLVTGAASGLGEATARMFLREGARVILADINPRGESLAAELGPNACFIPTDVTSEQDAARAIAAAADRFGALHGLVNCAGIAPAEKLSSRKGPHTLETFTRTIAVNLTGTFNMLRLAAVAMQANQPEEDGERGQAAYAASKAGVIGLTLPAARELASSGIRVVTIAPGLFLTPMMSSFPQPVQESLAQSIPFPTRLGHPDEFAALVATIIGQRLINGETIRLDGALRMAPR